MLMTKENTSEKLAYSVAEVSEKTSLSMAYLRKQITAKKLKAKLVGRRVLILNADLQNWLEGKENWENLNNRGENEK